MQLWMIALPLVMGFILAYVLNILVKKFEKIYFPKSNKGIVLKTRKFISIVLSVIMILLLIQLVINIVLPQVVNALLTLAAEIPKAVDKVNMWITQHQEELPIMGEQIQKINMDWNSISKTLANYAITGLGGLVTSVFGLASGVISGLFTLIMTVSFAIYLLLGKEPLLAQ